MKQDRRKVAMAAASAVVCDAAHSVLVGRAAQALSAEVAPGAARAAEAAAATEGAADEANVRGPGFPAASQPAVWDRKARCAMGACVRTGRLHRVGQRKPGNPMSVENNKRLIERLYEVGINRHDAAATAAIYSADALNHGRCVGRTGMQAVFQALSSTFPDFHYHIDECMAEG